jgi:hypothetical protein
MFFHPIDILIFIAFGISLWAQFKVQGNFSRYSQVPSASGLTGAEVARRILDQNGLYNVPVEMVPGQLTDHYDPIKRVVRLSEPVYLGRSIAAISVAAHEVGHAVQHKEAYGALALRHTIFPIANISSGIAPYLILIGFLLGISSSLGSTMIGIGIFLFSAVVLFQLITLPVEFNASSRAKKFMLSNGMIYDRESEGVNKVLGAAALTYVAAALISVLQLLKFVTIFLQSRDER